MSSDAHAQAFRALAGFLVVDASVAETLQRISDITLQALPAAEIAGISMLDERGTARTRIYTDELSPEIDEGQYSSGRGPCLEAWRTCTNVIVDDMEEALTGAYPEFAKLAIEHGILSTLSLGLVAANRGLGALNLYARSKYAFTSDDVIVATELASLASVVLANTSAYWEAFDLSQHLNQAIQSRAVIEQAKGMLMAQSPTLDPDGAFELLRHASQRENVKLRDIARRIVERRPIISPDS
jgi:GAF domain-containing protein